MLKFRLIQSWLPTDGMPSHFPYLNASHDHTQRLVPRKFEGLEAAVLIFCGVYGVLVAALLLQAAVLPLLLNLVVLALGILRVGKPARSKLQWLMDAAMVMGALMLLFADPRTGGGAGPYLYWVLLFAMTYPLLMDASSAIVFAAALLLIYFAVGRGAAAAAQPVLFALRGVLVAGICLLSARFGVVLRRSEETVEQLRRDLDSGAYNPHGWLRYGEPALRACQAQGQPLSLAYLNMPSDWAEQIVMARGYVSPKPQAMRALKAQALSEIAHSLMHSLPGHCLVGRDANGDWVLVLPGMSNAQALQQLQSIFGRPLQISFGPQRDEMFVSMMPCVVQAKGDETLQDLHARAVDVWQRGIKSGAV